MKHRRRYYLLYLTVGLIVAIKAVVTIYNASMVLLAHAQLQGLRAQETTLVKQQQNLEQQIAIARALTNLPELTLSQYQPIYKPIAIQDASLTNSTAQLPLGTLQTTP